MDQPEQTVSLGDKSVELSTLDRYKGRKGMKDRIGLVSKSLLRGNQHWFANRTFRCLTENPEQPAICCEKLGAPTQKFGCVVFHYVADHEGLLIDETKCSGTLKIWLLSEAKYQELSSINKQWALMDSGFDKPQYDLLIACTEEQFQRMTITPCPVAHWKKKESWYKAISMRTEMAKNRLVLTLGKKLPEAEVRGILGLTVVMQPPTQGPGDINLEDVLESAGPPTTPVTTAPLIPPNQAMPAAQSAATPVQPPTQAPAGEANDLLI